MSISVEQRTAKRYLWVAGFCALFALVYELFGHGVVSWYMVLLPLWPLLGGAHVFALLAWWRVRLSQLTRCLYHAGLSTLTVGSCMTGIFEIYGSVPAILRCYWIAGACLTTAALADFLWCRLRGRNS